MALQIYRPTSVVIPESTQIRRQFPDRRGRRVSPLNAMVESTGYDTRTILYDIWVDEGQGTLVAIGPPSINLKETLYPVEVMCNDQRLSISKTEYVKCSIWSAPLPASIQNSASYDVKINHRLFESRVNFSARPNPGRTASLSLVTLQKDNPAAWIRDWCVWHQRICGVERVLLYDNGSSDIPELQRTLSEIGKNMDVTLVHWPYPYGDTGHNNRMFAQVGALNHCRLMFGRRSEWLICTDIDEYLVIEDSEEFIRRLQMYERRGVVVVLLGSYWIPPVSDQLRMEQRSIRDYEFRERLVRSGGWVQKYLFCPSGVELNEVHFAFPKNRALGVLRGMPRLYQRLAGMIQRRVSQGWPAGVRCPFRRVLAESVDNAYYYHVRGLNTNWREQISDDVIQFDPAKHVYMDELEGLIRRAGLRR